MKWRTRSKRARYGLVILGLLLIAAALGGLKYCQISSLIAKGKEMEQAGPPPEAVGSAIAQTASWEATLSAVGSVTGVESVAVSNDAPGIVERIRFKSGDVVRRGQVLVELDAAPEEAQRASARARRDLARTSVARARALFEAGAIPREQLDRSETELATASSDLAALGAQTERKVIRAPFTGRLGIRAINLGQYLSPGTTITTLDAIGGVFVDFTVPQEQLATVRVGLPVRIEVQSTRETVEGRIAAIDPTIDAATRSVQLRATVQDGKTKLRPGMFVRVEVVLPERPTVVTVPVTAIAHAAYGDSVFVIEPKPPDSPGITTTPDGKPVKIARQQFVRVGQAQGDFVAIAEGIQAGAEVVSAGAFKLRNGSPVIVDNTVKAQPQANPRPTNR
jgi:membrane fusion protein (multidrug efflux system)